MSTLNLKTCTDTQEESWNEKENKILVMKWYEKYLQSILKSFGAFQKLSELLHLFAAIFQNSYFSMYLDELIGQLDSNYLWLKKIDWNKSFLIK